MKQPIKSLDIRRVPVLYLRFVWLSHIVDDFLTILEDLGYKGIGLVLEDLEEMTVIEK